MSSGGASSICRPTTYPPKSANVLPARGVIRDARIFRDIAADCITEVSLMISSNFSPAIGDEDTRKGHAQRTRAKDTSKGGSDAWVV